MMATSSCAELLQTLKLGLGLGKICSERAVSLNATNASIDSPARVLPGSLTRMSIEGSWSKAIVEAILLTIAVANTALAWGLHNIDAVPSAVAARNALGLTIKAEPQVAQGTKLAHGSLWGTEVHATTATAHHTRDSALNASVSLWPAGSQSRGLEG